MSAWSDVLIGIAVVAGSILLVKHIYMWNMYRRSIQTEIYSNYIEYQLRRKNLTRLSESYYLNSKFGKHRIVYQVAQGKGDKVPLAYIIIILTSGLYILGVKTQNGRVIAKKKGDFKQIYVDKKQKKGAREKTFLFRSPLDELRFFEKKLMEKLPGDALPVHDIVVFPQKCEISWDGEPDLTIPVIRRKETIGVLEEDFNRNKQALTESQVDIIFHMLADEAIQREKDGEC